ncbi:HAD family hydrolase [Streptomyces sp. H27-D2]|uniref:HAD family hydrolase n=1 Tax=Streptomyces sp. H27-D2 TaxID=3046304 RepID=UPI002DB88043|nr:HAD-IA family hydrolase [Streptomyces sp. H27-D2]MEC4019091.1 HAD-IA family hydrolase [Streptomyces sp. H27-D2]
MAIKAVLFDFSGTLFRIETTASWLRSVLDSAGISVPESEFARCTERLEVAGALPGGPAPRSVPPGLAQLWHDRDRTAELHRAAYTGLTREAELPWPGVCEALYERHREPAAWTPYPDAAGVLGELRGRGVGVGIVSNIGWDLRPVFRAHGLDAFVDSYTLSYEHGVQKPDGRLFETACQALGEAPQDTLMVGDDRHADGGAAALGCAVHFVDHLPAAERPDALRAVPALVG